MTQLLHACPESFKLDVVLSALLRFMAILYDSMFRFICLEIIFMSQRNKKVTIREFTEKQ